MRREIPVDTALEAGYNVRLLVDDFDGLIENWSQRSATFASKVDSVLDQPYDTGDRDKLDVFRCGKPGAPLFVFIHGGYWQRGDKSVYSFVAESFLQAGVDVALVGYELCPSATMEGMVDKHRTAVAWLWRNAADLGISADRINLSGHSAGGHLTAMLLATDWMRFAPDLPADILKTGIPISGLYQLAPIRQTTIADALGLDTEIAARISPQFLKPNMKAPILVTLGGGETPEFHWQTDRFVEEWRKYDPSIGYHAEPDVDHFGVVERLADSDSAIFGKVHDWLR